VDQPVPGWSPRAARTPVIPSPNVRSVNMIGQPIAKTAYDPDRKGLAMFPTNFTDLEWLVKRCAMPVVVKGVLRGDDAKPVAQLQGDPRLAAEVSRLEAEIALTKAVVDRTKQDLKSYEGLERIAKVRGDELKKASYGGHVSTRFITLVLFAASVSVQDANAELIIGLTTQNALIRFDSATPGTTFSAVSVSGLQSGETLLGIDYRPATGALYGVGSSSRLYTLNTATGVATQVGLGAFGALSGTDFGVDFNPVVDRLRIVSNTGQNLRVNPDTGALAGLGYQSKSGFGLGVRFIAGLTKVLLQQSGGEIYEANPLANLRIRDGAMDSLVTDEVAPLLMLPIGLALRKVA